MNREEILARSRSANYDEGLRYARDSGRLYASLGLSVIIVILLIVNFIKGISNSGVFAIAWIYFGCEYYGHYRISKKKSSLVKALIGFMIGIISLVIYIF